MKCITCKTVMKCIDDVNGASVRIDWLECPKCKSQAEVVFGQNGKYIEKVTWNR